MGGTMRMPGGRAVRRHLPGFEPHERTVRVLYAGDELNVTYRCDYEAMATFARRAGSRHATVTQQIPSACSLLERVIVEWDLLVSDAGPERYPATAEALARLDLDFLGAIVAGLTADYCAALAEYRARPADRVATRIAYRGARSR